MKFAIIFALLGACAAQDLPDAPQPTPKAFWALTAAYGGGILLDNYTTQRFERQGCVETTSPGLYGIRPREARFLAVSGGIAAAEVLAARWMVRRHSKSLRTVGYVALGSQVVDRYSSSIHNLGLRCR